MDRLPASAQILVGAVLALAGIEDLADDGALIKILGVVVLASGLANVAFGFRRRRA